MGVSEVGKLCGATYTAYHMRQGLTKETLSASQNHTTVDP